MLETLDNYEVKEPQQRELVTGPIVFRPVLVNPTRAQLNEFYGSDKKTDQIEYFGSKDIKGTPTDNLRIQFYGYFTGMDGKEYKGAIDPFWLTNKLWESDKTGTLKFSWINPYGRTSWTDTPENSPLASWYKGRARKSFMGEEDIMNFILSIIGINTFYSPDQDEKDLPTFITNGETFLDINKLFNKDYSELQTMITKYCISEFSSPPNHPFRDRKVVLITSVKARNDNGELQQTYYMKAFAKFLNRANSPNKKDIDRIIATINKEGTSEYGWKHSGVVTSVLQKFSPEAVSFSTTDSVTSGW